MLYEEPLNSGFTGAPCLAENYHKPCHLEAKLFTMEKLRRAANIWLALIRDSEKMGAIKKARMRNQKATNKNLFCLAVIIS
jgi:hypothetical protein